MTRPGRMVSVSEDREVIEPYDRDGEPAMAHLAPVMVALVQAGNEVVWRNENFGFRPAPHGWTAELTGPIDFDLIEARFELPDSVILDREGDKIWDEGNQAVVLGGEAARRAREEYERHNP